MSARDAPPVATVWPRPASADADGWLAHVLWGSAGFVLGVVAWHFVGFWTFVSAVVFRGPEPQTPSALSDFVRAHAPAATERRETPTGTDVDRRAKANAGNDPRCSTLVLDRATQTTRLAPCSAGATAHTIVFASRRADRLTSSTTPEPGWAMTVEAQTPTADSD